MRPNHPSITSTFRALGPSIGFPSTQERNQDDDLRSSLQRRFPAAAVHVFTAKGRTRVSWGGRDNRREAFFGAGPTADAVAKVIINSYGSPKQ